MSILGIHKTYEYMGRNELKSSIELRSLVREERIETYFEIPTFLS
jgi:hypothetical protein